LKTAFLSITLITATFYVYTTITPALARQGYFVRIGVTGYSPSSLAISKGDFVTWSNEDPSGSPPVTVTSDTGAFDSGDIKPGGAFNHTFNTPGTYKYSDKHHPSNKGKIIVT
jgi:plastocyanin